MSQAAWRADLCRLAERQGVAVSYEDAFGARRDVSDETLVAVLAALGEPIAAPREASRVLEGELAQQLAEVRRPPAVVVAWDGELPPVTIGPADSRRAAVLALALEDGSDASSLLSRQTRGELTVVRASGPLPFGRHELAVELPERTRGSSPGAPSRLEGAPDEVTVISAPAAARRLGPAAWGAFAPAYGLSDPERGGGGDLSALGRLGRFVARKGGSYLATLPLLADFSAREEPGARPSPYSPLSRLWWNEGYLDPALLPELELPSELLAPGPPPGSAAERAAALRPLLAAAARRLRAAGGPRHDSFDSFLASRPGVYSYARFRAACEQAGLDRSRWPERWRHGLVDERELDPAAVEAHLYAQFALDEQLGLIARQLGEAGSGLMLDLPLGCRADGFDPWAFPDAFATGVRIGAPPDRFFTKGQDWGFPPLKPEAERRTGYAVTAAALANLLSHSAALRIDHALGLSRLWWIPDGFPAEQGTYVSYQAEELIALCCLEAWRAGAALVGENLGTVEESLTATLTSHGIAGMSVAVFDLEGEDAHPMEPLSPPSCSMALVDTHDTATFAGWFTGRDLSERLRLGLLEPAEARAQGAERERARRTLVDRLVASRHLAPERAADPVAVHAGVLAELALSPAELVMVNLEDCWGELDPQNVPGTTDQHRNFARPLARTLPEIEADPGVLGAFEQVSQLRGALAEPGPGRE